ncbi:LOW QUALITY PROTEIN: hypothetical protein BU14_0492s0012 [Porphyra umbilicalis]|uniref:Uncharacterized protein n=1 Tax=Porphyra umbilicalis TaxID=2786 RepID=A0A1X6NTF1_PORUM|nr:LOW QUALITY PROTEIN: hypothetical protein BU14_0492s0012 [Porphyra umbilicalis]|eukprot:OSX71892.1 LOW QUALITY PROTEIN: hypothetical protein BU14_0492s0012 [Porphyra umbilicalis]
MYKIQTQNEPPPRAVERGPPSSAARGRRCCGTGTQGPPRILRRRRCVDRQPNLAGDDRVESGVKTPVPGQPTKHDLHRLAATARDPPGTVHDGRFLMMRLHVHVHTSLINLSVLIVVSHDMAAWSTPIVCRSNLERSHLVGHSLRGNVDSLAASDKAEPFAAGAECTAGHREVPADTICAYDHVAKYLNRSEAVKPAAGELDERVPPPALPPGDAAASAGARGEGQWEARTAGSGARAHGALPASLRVPWNSEEVFRCSPTRNFARARVWVSPPLPPRHPPASTSPARTAAADAPRRAAAGRTARRACQVRGGAAPPPPPPRRRGGSADGGGARRGAPPHTSPPRHGLTGGRRRRRRQRPLGAGARAGIGAAAPPTAAAAAAAALATAATTTGGGGGGAFCSLDHDGRCRFWARKAATTDCGDPTVAVVSVGRVQRRQGAVGGWGGGIAAAPGSVGGGGRGGCLRRTRSKRANAARPPWALAAAAPAPKIGGRRRHRGWLAAPVCRSPYDRLRRVAGGGSGKRVIAHSAAVVGGGVVDARPCGLDRRPAASRLVLGAASAAAHAARCVDEVGVAPGKRLGGMRRPLIAVEGGSGGRVTPATTATDLPSLRWAAGRSPPRSSAVAAAVVHASVTGGQPPCHRDDAERRRRLRLLCWRGRVRPAVDRRQRRWGLGASTLPPPRPDVARETGGTPCGWDCGVVAAHIVASGGGASRGCCSRDTCRERANPARLPSAVTADTAHPTMGGRARLHGLCRDQEADVHVRAGGGRPHRGRVTWPQRLPQGAGLRHPGGPHPGGWGSRHRSRCCAERPRTRCARGGDSGGGSTSEGASVRASASAVPTLMSASTPMAGRSPARRAATAAAAASTGRTWSVVGAQQYRRVARLRHGQRSHTRTVQSVGTGGSKSPCWDQTGWFETPPKRPYWTGLHWTVSVNGADDRMRSSYRHGRQNFKFLAEDFD